MILSYCAKMVEVDRVILGFCIVYKASRNAIAKLKQCAGAAIRGKSGKGWILLLVFNNRQLQSLNRS